MSTALGLILPSLAVYAWLGLGSSTSRLLRVALAPGLGLGAASCLYLFLLVLSSSHTIAVRGDLAFWALALVVAASFRLGSQLRRSRVGPNQLGGWRWPAPPSLLAVAVTFIAVAGLAAATFLVRISIEPHGEWDAWAIWNLRARALWRGAPDWPAIFSPELGWSHPDYPLMLPISIARLWAYAGRESLAAPALIAAIFLAATAATVAVSIGEQRGWTAGFLSGAMLIAPRSYVFDATCQCADIPLGFFVMVAIACVTIAIRRELEHRWQWLVCGLAAGLAAWTKNEGQLALLVVGLVVVVAAFRRPRRIVLFLAGASIPAAALVLFKLRLATSTNYLFEPQSIAGVWGRLADLTRWSFVVNSVFWTGLGWGQVPMGALAILGGVVTLTACDVRTGIRPGLVALGLLAVVMTGYITAFVMTPLPLEWQIRTSLARLLSQLWPALVWALFQFAGAAKERETVAAPAVAS